MSAMTEKEKQPSRLRTLFHGLAILVAAVVVGVSLLYVIGLLPGHQESRVLVALIAVISLATMFGMMYGVWLITKALLGLR